MKNSILIITCFFSFFVIGQTNNYKVGEYLKYRIHYLGVSAGYSTLEVKDKKLNGQEHFNVIGKGWTTGLTRFFFKVEDLYESYIDKRTGMPSKFIRKINEGGYTKNKTLTFNRSTNEIELNDIKHKEKKSFSFKDAKIQDMLSSFYYLRNQDTSTMKIGDVIDIGMFMDEEETTMKLKILGRELKKIKNIGKIKCLKIRPYVASGRVFKEKESVTLWVTDDQNHIPVEIKASLAVGSLKATLVEYKNLKNTLVFN